MDHWQIFVVNGRKGGHNRKIFIVVFCDSKKIIREEKKAKPAPHSMLFVGLAFLALAIVFLVLFNRVFIILLLGVLI